MPRGSGIASTLFRAALLALLVLLPASVALAGSGGTAASGPSGGVAPQSVEGMPDVPFAVEIALAADQNGVDRLLLTALVRAESNFDPDITSRAGARGLTQLMPGTARELGLTVSRRRRGLDERVIPALNLDAGARYLRTQLDRFRKVKLALAAYNAGPRAVRRHRGIPPYRQTRTYVRKVLAFEREYRTLLGLPPAVR